MTHEEEVRSVWEKVDLTGRDDHWSTLPFGVIGLSGPCATEAKAWAAAAEFTRERLEQVRQLREEMGIVISSQMTAANYANDLWPGDSDRQKWLHRYELWSGILTILEAERARLTAGMKPDVQP